MPLSAYGQHVGFHAAHVFEQGLAQLVCGCFRGGQGNTQDGVGTQVRLVRRTVDPDHFAVQPRLVKDGTAHQCIRQDTVHVFHGPGNVLAHVAGCIPVPQLHRFVGSGGGPGRNGRTAKPALGRQYFHLNGGISAGVQHPPCVNIRNIAHACFSYLRAIVTFPP